VIEYYGPIPVEKNFRRVVNEPAHQMVADMLGLRYVDGEVIALSEVAVDE